MISLAKRVPTAQTAGRASLTLVVWLSVVAPARPQGESQSLDARINRRHGDLLADVIDRNRLNARGAVVLDRLRSKYRDSRDRTAELDEVFEPDRPFTARLGMEVARMRSFLARIYPPDNAPEADRMLAARIVTLSRSYWPKPEEYASESEPYQEAFRIFKAVILDALPTTVQASETPPPRDAKRTDPLAELLAAADARVEAPITQPTSASTSLERRGQGGCPSPAAVMAQVRELAAQAGVQLVGTSSRNPRQVAALRWNAPEGLASSREAIPAELGALWFRIDPSSGGCSHMVGLQAAPGASAHLVPVLDEVSRAIGRPPTACPAFAAAPGASSDLRKNGEWLNASRTRDPVYRDLTEEARASLRVLLADPALRDGLTLAIVNGTQVATGPGIKVDTCASFLEGFDGPTVLCNERFLAEMEIVVRSTEQDNPALASDAGLLALVDTVRSSGPEALPKLRAADASRYGPGYAEHIQLHLRLLLLFFAGHEVGHLLQCRNAQPWAPAPAPAVSELDFKKAVTRLCRHSEEFLRHGFRLPGMDVLVGRGGVAREVSLVFEREHAALSRALNQGFWEELAADDNARDLVLELLARSDKEDPKRARLEEHVLFETVFVVSLYSWYRDFVRFRREQCGTLGGTAELALCLGLARDKYLAAASLFGGDVHASVVLRALTLLEAMVAERTSYYRGRPADRTIWLPNNFEELGEPQRRDAIWRAGDLQRFELLSALTDTPGKIAFTGCTSGWVASVRQTPPAMIFEFYSLERELERLKRLP